MRPALRDSLHVQLGAETCGREASRTGGLRERLLARGAAVLADDELLAILTDGETSTPARAEVLRRFLRDHGGLAGVRTATASLLRHAGLSAMRSARLLAAVELARRLAFAELPEREPMRRPAEVVRYLCLAFPVRDQEVLGALFLDGKSRLLACREIYRGTRDRIAAEPRGILKEALLLEASALVLFHNHPSGDPTPSTEDLLLTRRIALAAKTLGLVLVDHLILGGPSRWLSLRDKGALESPLPSLTPAR